MIEFFLKDFYVIILVFGRVGAAMMTFPGFSEPYVYPRIRLFIAILLSIVVSNIIPHQAEYSWQPYMVFTDLVREMLIGVIIGAVCKMLLMLLDTVGNIISFQIGLSNAMVFNPSLQSQTPLPSTFLTITGVTILFVADLHHLMIKGVVSSYQSFPLHAPIDFNMMEDYSKFVLKLVKNVFYIGVQISIPFLIAGVIFQIILGLLNRLMPQLQVFFIAIPIQLYGGILLMLILSASLFFAFQQMFIEQVGYFLDHG